MLRKKELDFIKEHEQEACDLLLELARIPAPSGHEERRGAFCREWLEKNGAKGVYMDEALNVVYPASAGEEKPLAVFAAHTDVVFPDREELPLTVDGNIIRCPGAGDDTACLVALMMAAKYVARGLADGSLRPKETGVLFVCNSCEEGLGNLKGSREICRRYGERMREFVSFDCHLDQMYNRAVGSQRYRITIQTQGGHSYADFGRPNAIARLAELIGCLYKIQVPTEGKTTFNVGTISGGTSVNTIAQEAWMLYEFRSDVRSSLQYMEERFMEIIRQEQKKGDMKLLVETVGIRPCGADVDEKRQRDLEERVKRAAAAAAGKEPRASAASTDCNIPLSMGIPSVCAGTFYGGGAHTREEFVDSASLPMGVQVAMDLVLEHFERLGD